MLRGTVRFVLCFLTSIAALNAQTPDSVPAVVIDRSGQSVHGLQKSDFEVRCGKSASFDSTEEVLPLRFDGFADPIPVFILFDETSVARKIQTDVSRLLLTYLRKAADEHLAVTLLVNTPTGVRVIHDMSTDPTVFAAAINRIVPPTTQPPGQELVGKSEQFLKAVNDEAANLNELMKPVPPLVNENMESRYTRQLQGLQIVGRMLQRSRKRKPLIWITGDFPLFVENGGLIHKFDYIARGNVPMQSTENVGLSIPFMKQRLIR